MKIVLTSLQIIIGLVLTALIFLQAPGDSESKSNILSASTPQKRGWEKVTFYLTLGALFLFILNSLALSIL
jgi:protein translocase SecG subunit